MNWTYVGGAALAAGVAYLVKGRADKSLTIEVTEVIYSGHDGTIIKFKDANGVAVSAYQGSGETWIDQATDKSIIRPIAKKLTAARTDYLNKVFSTNLAKPKARKL